MSTESMVMACARLSRCTNEVSGVCVLVRMMHMLAYVVKDSVGGHVQVGTIALLPRLEGVGLWAGRERLRRGKWDCVWGGNVCSVV